MFHDDLPLSNCSKSPDVFQFRGQFWRTWYSFLAGLDERLCGRKKILDILNTWLRFLQDRVTLLQSTVCPPKKVDFSIVFWEMFSPIYFKLPTQSLHKTYEHYDYIWQMYRTALKSTFFFSVTKTYIIHLVLKSPVFVDAKRVDKAGVLLENQIQADELVTIHLFPVGRDPLTTNPL